jgi:hypothetical protein
MSKASAVKIALFITKKFLKAYIRGKNMTIKIGSTDFWLPFIAPKATLENVKKITKTLNLTSIPKHWKTW